LKATDFDSQWLFYLEFLKFSFSISKGNDMIGYTCVGTNNLEKAVQFYSELLSLLNAKPFFKSDRGVGWGVSPDKPMFSVMKPFDG
jgi:hypothetical protein